MAKMKCGCKVEIFNQSRKRNCKGSVFITLNKISYCWIHSTKILGKSTILIQSIFRGKRCRRKIRNLYLNLPPELKNIVLFYINQQHNYELYKNLCTRIITNKINNIDYLIKYPLLLNQLSYIDIVNFIEKIKKIYNILINNWEIINFKIISDENMSKLYMFAHHKIWGITTWNGVCLYNILYYTLDQNIILRDSIDLLIKKFYKLWNKNFIYYRVNSSDAYIVNR